MLREYFFYWWLRKNTYEITRLLKCALNWYGMEILEWTRVLPRKVLPPPGVLCCASANRKQSRAIRYQLQPAPRVQVCRSSAMNRWIVGWMDGSTVSEPGGALVSCSAVPLLLLQPLARCQFLIKLWTHINICHWGRADVAAQICKVLW